MYTVVSLQHYCKACVCVHVCVSEAGFTRESDQTTLNETSGGQCKKNNCAAKSGPDVQVCIATERNLSVSFILCQAELQKLRQQALETKHFIEKQEAEERKLLRIIAEADGERLRQKKELDQVGTPPHQTCRSHLQTQLFASTFHESPFFSRLCIPSVGRTAVETHLLLITYEIVIHYSSHIYEHLLSFRHWEYPDQWENKVPVLRDLIFQYNIIAHM